MVNKVQKEVLIDKQYKIKLIQINNNQNIVALLKIKIPYHYHI